MTSFNRGDIILVDIVFSGAIGSKRRPAVVISTERFNKSGSKLIVVGITSNISVPFRPDDTAFSQFNSYSVTVRTELVEVCRSCFDKLSTNGGCNCPKLKTLYLVN